VNATSEDVSCRLLSPSHLRDSSSPGSTKQHTENSSPMGANESICGDCSSDVQDMPQRKPAQKPVAAFRVVSICALPSMPAIATPSRLVCALSLSHAPPAHVFMLFTPVQEGPSTNVKDDDAGGFLECHLCKQVSSYVRN